MGYLSQAGHVGLKTQVSKGTYADPGETSGDRVYTVTFSAGTDGGTWRVAVNGDYTTELAWDVTTGDLTTALEALLGVGAGTITVTGTAGQEYVLTSDPTDGYTFEIFEELTDGGVPESPTTTFDPGDLTGVFMRIRSGALGGNRDLLIPDPEIGGNRDISDAQLGPINFTGEYDFYARMESLPTLVQAVMGSSTTTGNAATGYTHTSETTDRLPWLSVEEVIADSYEQFKYTDVKVNTLHLEADAGGYLMGTIGLIGLTQEILVTPTAEVDQRWDLSPLSVGTSIVFLWNGVQLPAKSFSLDINNNLEDDDFRLGSLFLGDAVEKRREVTLGATIRPEDSGLWRTAMWGSPTATQPLGTSYKDDISIVITTYEDIPGANAGVKYRCTITVPKAIIRPFSLSPSGDDVLEHDIEFQAVRPDPGTDIITVATRNSYATVA